MFHPSRVLTVVLATFLFAFPAIAADFSFDVPELEGLYQGHHGNRHVDLDLGTKFARIDGVSLRLVGNHTPGIIRLLSHDAADEPYPAEVIGYFPEAGPSFTTAFDELLPPVQGSFDVTFDFDNLRFHGGEPNFDPLLDGHARLNISVGGPPVIAIYAIKALPFIHVDSATLFISGHAGHEHHMLHGDYDHNGHVDHADHALWRATWGSSADLRADGNGDGIVDAADYALWRRSMGDTHASAALATSVPEPAAAALAISLACLLALRRRRLV